MRKKFARGLQSRISDVRSERQRHQPPQRAVQTASYTFHALKRLTAEHLRGSEPDIAYAYDQ
jgi:rRNA pseudouridine-1189 N-methylase Emg1 (Nep1/Mra1 family)